MSDSQRSGMESGHAAPAVASDARPVVLIAEDERPIAEALCVIIEDAGYRAVVARNGDHALELARRQLPALVITDYMMPHMNGVQFLLALREDARLRGQNAPPVVLMSAADLPIANESQADAIIRKPFNLEEIEAIMRRFIGMARQTGT